MPFLECPTSLQSPSGSLGFNITILSGLRWQFCSVLDNPVLGFPLLTVQLLAICSLAFCRVVILGLTYMIFWLKHTSLFKLLASWRQLFNFCFKTVTCFFSFPMMLDMRWALCKRWVTDDLNEGIFPCTCVVGILSPLLGSQFGNRKIATYYLLFLRLSSFTGCPFSHYLLTMWWWFIFPSFSVLINDLLQSLGFKKPKNIICS